MHPHLTALPAHLGPIHQFLHADLGMSQHAGTVLLMLIIGAVVVLGLVGIGRRVVG